MTIENLKVSETPVKSNKWDRIKRKYSSNVNLNSETVKKFLQTEFISDQSMKLMKGDSKSLDSLNALNPAIVMDLRHELIRSKTRDPSAKSIQYRDYQLENAKKHNEMVELKLIENELTKFKSKIGGFKTKKSNYNPEFLEDEDRNILKLLRDSEQLIREFENRKNCDKVELPQIRDSSESPDNKNVHFGNIKVITYPKSAIPTVPPIKNEVDSSSADTDCESSDDFFKNYDFNDDSDDTDDKNCHMCYPGEDFLDFEAENRRDFDVQSFHSLPNLTDGEIDSFLKVSRFQSMQNVNDGLTDDFPCCMDLCQNQRHDVQLKSQKIRTTQEKLQDSETNKFLLVKRMEIEEKNYRELVICNNSYREETSQYFQGSSAITQEIKIDLNKEILRIYFQKWLNFVTIEKIIKTNAFTNEDHVKKINNFLNKIRCEQNRNTNKHKPSQRRQSNSSIVNKLEGKKVRKDYEHKLKVQQDIIELQKLKLERQERLITEMKLAKFSEMLKDSKIELKNTLKSAAKKGNIRLRTKARCIQIAANIKSDPEEDERRKLLAQGLIMPKFLAKMQERAVERLQRHEDARQRRIRLEQEKEELKTALELAKREEDEKAKQARIREMRENRKKEKIMKILKEQERQQYLENLKKAREHYNRKLLKNVGFQAFQMLIKQKRTNLKKALLHRRRSYMKKYFICWAQTTKEIWARKREKAEQNFSRILVKHNFKIWREVYKIRQSRMLVAIDWYEMKITEKLLHVWYIRMKQFKIIESGKMKSAETHYNCQIKWKIFDHWRRLPQIMKIEKETEVRRQKWRLKIMDIINDYTPSSIHE